MNDAHALPDDVHNALKRAAFSEAERLLRAHLEKEPENALKLRALAQTLFEQNRLEEALCTMEALLELAPFSSFYVNDYAAMLLRAARYLEAENAARMALSLDKSAHDAHFNLALALFHQTKYEDALFVLDILLAQRPDFVEALSLKGEIFAHRAQTKEAKTAFYEAIKKGDLRADTFIRLSELLCQEASDLHELPEEAQAKIQPFLASVHLQLGNREKEKGDFAKAQHHFEEALLQNAGMVEAANNLALSLKAQNKTEEAQAVLEKALAQYPDHAGLLTNFVLYTLSDNRLEEAIVHLEKALSLAPDSLAAMNNLALVYMRRHRFTEAESLFKKVIDQSPDYEGASLNLGMLYLLQARFAEAWPLFETRWRLRPLKDTVADLHLPRWQGEPLEGKSLLIHAEQGFGDNLQFIRYLEPLRKRLPNTHLLCVTRPALLKLFTPYADQFEVEITSSLAGTFLPHYDAEVPLMSIPGILGTDLSTIPAPHAYLAPTPDLVFRFEKILAHQNLSPHRMKIGIVWKSGTGFRDHKTRNCPLSLWTPLLKTENVQWISLQQGKEALSELEKLNPDRSILDLSHEISDFADTAALIAHLDLVISVDTSVAHLAGAMGIPTWLLNRFESDWRWLIEREDSPWYPSMRIFRQETPANWEGLLSKTKRALDALLKEPFKKMPVPSTPLFPTLLGSEKVRYRLVHAKHGYMLANPHDFYVGSAVISYGAYSEAEAAFLLTLSQEKPKGRIVEVGANMGAFSLPLAKEAAKRGVSMDVFEPQPVVFQNLCANLALNGITHVRAWPFACGEREETLYLQQINYGQSNNFGGVSMRAHADLTATLPIPCVRLDDFLSEEPIALIKIDVEGAERAVLKGARQKILTHRPLLYVENDREDQSADLIAYLRALGYRLFWHRPPLFQADHFFARAYDKYGKMRSTNLICLPSERPPLDGFEEIKA